MKTYLAHIGGSMNIYVVAIGVAIEPETADDKWVYLDEMTEAPTGPVHITYADTFRDVSTYGPLVKTDEGWKLWARIGIISFRELTKELYDTFLLKEYRKEFASTEELQEFYRKVYDGR